MEIQGLCGLVSQGVILSAVETEHRDITYTTNYATKTIIIH